MLKNVYIAGGVRTPFGSLGGVLSTMSAAQLGSVVIRDTLQRTRVDGREVDEVLFGNVIQAGAGQSIPLEIHSVTYVIESYSDLVAFFQKTDIDRVISVHGNRVIFVPPWRKCARFGLRELCFL